MPGERSKEQVTMLLQAMERGDRRAAEELLPMVYDELRDLASARLAGERVGQTLQATALVHEAYLRIVGEPAERKWDSRGHFFAAAAIAMRRILVERARYRNAQKRGGGAPKAELDPDQAVSHDGQDRLDLLALDEALTKLEAYDARKAQVVLLRFFAGLSIEETAVAMELSPATVKNEWAFARAWLHREMGGNKGPAS